MSQVLLAVLPPQRVGQDCCWARHQVFLWVESTDEGWTVDEGWQVAPVLL